MEDNTQKTVVSINTHRASSQSRIEIEGAQRCIGIISWELQVQQALSLCGIHISDALLSGDIVPSANSHASLIGHKTLESLVSKPFNEDGLNLNWSEFKAQMFALVYRTKLAIDESSYVEINARVKDATEILGHPPVNAAEFHRAKETVLQSTIASITKESKARVDDLQERNKDLIRELNSERAVVGEMRAAQKTAMEESASRIQQMTRELAVKQDGYEREAKEKITVEVARAEASFNQRLAAAQADMASQILSAQAERKEAEDALVEITARIEAGELIEASRLVEMNVRLDQAKDTEAALRRQMLEINDKLIQSDKRADLLVADKESLMATIDSMSVQMAMLEQRMREQVEDKMSSSEFAVLHERLQVRKEEFEAQSVLLASVTKERDDAIQAISQLRGRFAQLKQVGSEHFGKMAAQLQAVNDQYAALMAKHAKHGSAITQYRFVLGGVITIAIMACSGMFVLMH